MLDAMLPGLDGIGVCRRLGEAGIWVPVLMLTARDGPAAFGHAVTAGDDVRIWWAALVLWGALISDGSCRTATHAVVPLRSNPGFNLERGGRLVGRYHRPPFSGCVWITPLVNLLVAGPGNAVVIDLIRRAFKPAV